MEKKKLYTPPALTAVEFRAELGFATSATTIMDNLIQQIGAEQNNLQAWGEFQFVTGFNTGQPGDEGLAAGYFNRGDVSYWFGD